MHLLLFLVFTCFGEERYKCSDIPDHADLSGCDNCEMNNCVLECDCGLGKTSIDTRYQCTDGTITSIGGALVCVNTGGNSMEEAMEIYNREGACTNGDGWCTGGGLDVFQKMELEQCKARCLDNPLCVTISHGQTCVLHNSNSWRNRRYCQCVAPGTGTTFIKTTDSSGDNMEIYNRAGACTNGDGWCTGGGLDVFRQIDLEECKAKCLDNPLCVTISYGQRCVSHNSDSWRNRQYCQCVGRGTGTTFIKNLVPKPITPYEEYGDVNELIANQMPCNEIPMDDNQCRSKSTTVFQPATSSSESDFNGLLWSFGQFVDHDLDLILEDEHDQVDVPFDSEHAFKFSRAESHCEDGEYGQRKNAISARFDLSQVYGSTLERENELRDPNNPTKIKAVDSDVLPPSPTEIFCCGDARCAENPFLTAQHILWLKHHNKLVDELVSSGSELSEEDLYQEAKRQNIAIYQRIVDEEFLPALVGPTPPAITVNSGQWILQTDDSAKLDIGFLSLNEDGIKVSLELCRDMVSSLDVCKKQYISYSTSGECACTTVDTTGIATGFSEWKTYTISSEWNDEKPSRGDMSISNLFANAAYRLHHLVNDKFDIDGNEDRLSNHFFNAQSFVDNGKLDGWFTRLLKQKSNKFGATMANSLQHALFSSPIQHCQDDNTDCRDLVALNCLRGVDVGLPRYNEVREMFGLPPREDFDWSTCDGNLETVYGGDIDNVELFVGGSCEEPMQGAVLGETFLVIVKDQFLRLRDNDPNWIGHQSRGFTYKEVIQRCTNVDDDLFHSHSSLLHHTSN